ncbi:hypothetical protein ACGFYT_16975 [Streptomyces sp. NPDC048208]|uniref:hypothetical protein n=1 Tax=Streptomyces sp. NPDC048208 TaxID=3365515 RepID=UPI0037161B45
MRANCPRTITIATILLVIAGLAGAAAVVLSNARTVTKVASDHHEGERAPRTDLARSVADFTRGFGPGHGYREPGRADRTAVATAIGLLLDGHRHEAEQQLSQRDFTVRTIVDQVSGRRYAEVADRTDDAVAPRGWGRFYLDLDHRPRWSVQVPHPVADQGTEQLAVRVLRDSPGGVLVIAGAHRKAGEGNAADVAHRRDTVFHAVCAELARRGMPGVQLHGFAASSAPDHDVIASTGVGREGRSDGRALADALGTHGFRVCRAWARTCPLEGQENMQGRVADARHVPFLHVEFAPAVRGAEAAAEQVAHDIGVVTRRWEQAPSAR